MAQLGIRLDSKIYLYFIDQIKLQICNGKLGCCCWTDVLDNPNKNDYELGNVDHFDSAEDGLGDCLNFPFPSTNADLRVFMQHSGSDAWYGEKIWIALQVSNMKSVNLQYNTPDLWADGTND